jgi:hypothetical protein
LYVGVGDNNLRKVTFLRGRALLLIALIAALCSISIPNASAQEAGIAILEVEPDTLTIPEEDIGTSFTVNVTIAYQPEDPENLSEYIVGLEFKLGFDPAILEATSVDLPEGHFMTPANPDNLYILAQTAYSNYVYYGVTIFTCAPPDWEEAPKDGTGVLVTITFVSKAAGETTLDLYDAIVAGAIGPPVIENILSHTLNDGTVVVVPEFSGFMLLLLLMVATVFAIILGRKSLLTKHLV